MWHLFWLIDASLTSTVKKTEQSKCNNSSLRGKTLFEKKKDLDNPMKDVQSLITEGSNRLEIALKYGVLSEVQAAQLSITGGREKLVVVTEKQRQVIM